MLSWIIEFFLDRIDVLETGLYYPLIVPDFFITAVLLEERAEFDVMLFPTKFIDLRLIRVSLRNFSFSLNKSSFFFSNL